MEGIDLCNQRVSYYRVLLKSHKWVLRMIFYVLDIEMCNSWLEYKEDSNANSINLQSKNTFDLLSFKQNIAESLVMLDNLNVVTYIDVKQKVTYLFYIYLFLLLIKM